MVVRSILLPAEPLEAPEVVEIMPGDVGEKLTQFVLGPFERVDVGSDVSLWLNEEGKLLGLPFNQYAQTLWRQQYGANTDLLVGPAVLTGGADEEGETLGLSIPQITEIEQRLGMLQVHLENTYEDGHSSERTILVSIPANPEDEDEFEDWWADEVGPHTGDGHGAENPKLGSLYEATIMSGPEALIGKNYEWG